MDNIETTIHQWLTGLQNLPWEQFHFLRPAAFWLLAPFLLYGLYHFRYRNERQHWLAVCDEALLPHVLDTRPGRRSHLPRTLVFLSVLLAVTALAGPVFHKLPQPVYRDPSALVVLLDLSQSMNARDIKPSRIERARLELLDILKQRKSGQTALVVFAAEAFTVTPLTDDNETIANLVTALTPAMMPAQGSNLTRALQQAENLLKQAGIRHGHILLIGDAIDERDGDAIEKIAARGHRFSVFAIGTAAGAPVPAEQGFLQDENGAIVIPKLDERQMRRMALRGGGLFTGLYAGDEDTTRLTRLFGQTLDPSPGKDDRAEQTTADVWQEEGPWLLLPLLPLAALWARRGWLAIFIVFLLPPAPDAFAGEVSEHWYDHLWRTPDQQAMRDFRQGKHAQAARTFRQPAWKASALYRSGDYAQAGQLFDSVIEQQEAAGADDPQQLADTHYNRGNALARSGRLQPAIEDYRRALELDPDNDDARYNLELVEKALEQAKSRQTGSAQNDPGEPAGDDEQEDGRQQNANPPSQAPGARNDEAEQPDTPDDESSPSPENRTDDDSRAGDESSPDENAGDDANRSDDPNDDNNDDQRDEGQPGDAARQKRQDEAMKKRHPQDRDSRQKQQEAESLQASQPDETPAPDEKPQADTRRNPDRKAAQAPHPPPPETRNIDALDARINEDKRATEQWLRRIKDDPAGLLRRKFLYQYNADSNHRDSRQPW